MPYVRSVSKPAPWRPDRSVDLLGDARAAFALRQDDEGLSIFKITCPADCDHVVAALALRNKRDNTIDLVEIEDADLDGLGAPLPSSGDTPLAPANAMHRELMWPQNSLDQLAARLFDRRAALHHYTPPRVRTQLLAIALDEVISASHREWLAAYQLGKSAK